MRAVILMYIRQYTNQKYPVWIALVLGAIFLIGYMLWSLSIADSVYTFGTMSLGWVELFGIALAIYGAIYANKQLMGNYNHILHAQWVSYQKLYLLWWMIGLLPLLYMVCILLLISIPIVLLQSQFSFALILIIIAVSLQSILLYTTLYTLLPYIQRFVATLFSLVLYIAAYSLSLIYTLAEQMDYLWRWLLYAFVYIMPQFFNYNINILGQDWIFHNFFSIAIVYGIYTIWLLVMGSVIYHRITRK